MLQVTSSAAEFLRDARSQQGFPDSFGVRLQARGPDPLGGVRLAFAEGPVEGDLVGETEGVRLFVAPEIAETLAEQAIDTQETPTGSDLVLRDQSEVAE
jgi:Fe-S cluster assembly iron-binding protein IscA